MATGYDPNAPHRPLSGSSRLQHGGWGSQPSGPLLNMRSYAGGAKGPRGWLPGKEAVDYVHSLTQTTLLLIGLAVFLLLYRRRPLTAARKLVGRVA